jgi:Tfp pilus assembly protein PilO
MVGLLFSAWYFVFKNADAEIERLNADTAQKRERLAQVKNASDKIQDMGKKIEELQQAIRLIEAKLPRERETKDIVRQIDLQARNYRQLQVPTVKALRPEKAATYYEQPVKLQMSGDFKSFYEFLQKIEKLTRITRLNQRRVTKLNEFDGSRQADLTLSIYYAPDPVK